MSAIVVDTGPLVAYFNRRDHWHRWTALQLAAVSPPLLTCEAVLAEAAYLIQRAGGRPADLIGKLAQGVLRIDIELPVDAAPIAALLNRYEDTPMSLADACLVRLTERVADCRLLTLDADFEHYRRNGRQVIPLIRPQGT